MMHTVWSAEWNADESLILTSSSSDFGGDGTAKLWDAESGELIHTLSHEDTVWSAEWNADESLILTRSSMTAPPSSGMQRAGS